MVQPTTRHRPVSPAIPADNLTSPPSAKPVAYVHPAYAHLAPLVQARKRRSKTPPPPATSTKDAVDKAAGDAAPSPWADLPTDIFHVLVDHGTALELSHVNRTWRMALAHRAVLEQLELQTNLLCEETVEPARRMTTVINVLGMPPTDGRPGNGVFGLPDSPSQQAMLDRLQTVVTRFGYDDLGRSGGGPSRSRTLRVDPTISMVRLYANLIMKAAHAEDFIGLLGRAPDANGHGGIGIAALPVDEQICLLHPVCGRLHMNAAVAALPAVTKAVLATGDAALLTPLLVYTSDHQGPNGIDVVRAVHAASLEAPARCFEVLPLLAQRLDILPETFDERDKAFEAHLCAWESLVPDAAALLSNSEASDHAMGEWARRLICVCPDVAPPSITSRIESVLTAFEVPVEPFRQFNDSRNVLLERYRVRDDDTSDAVVDAPAPPQSFLG